MNLRPRKMMAVLLQAAVVISMTALVLPAGISQGLSAGFPSLGMIYYPSAPPINSAYYSYWNSSERVATDFLSYLTGRNFDFNGFFDHLYAKFLKELETTTFGTGYKRPTLSYGSPTYSAGSAVGNLESIATYVCTSESQIRNALNSCSSGDIIFIKAGNYTVAPLTLSNKSNIIIAGEGWNTILRQADGYNQWVLSGVLECRNVIVRDLMIDGNMNGNPIQNGWNALEFRTAPTNILFENVKVINARRYGLYFTDANKTYMINCVSINSGWNNAEQARCSYGAAIGNYFQDPRDVGYSTWGSNNLVVANNIAIGGINDGLGSNDANWGIGVEAQGNPSDPYDTHNIIIRNNICNNHNAANNTQFWLGVGIWCASEETNVSGSYNIIIDGNAAENNNLNGIRVTNSTKYPDGSSIVVINNHAEGNDIYDHKAQGYPYAGNYVIERSGVIFQNNS